jgi:hypothetical protein
MLEIRWKETVVSSDFSASVILSKGGMEFLTNGKPTYFKSPMVNCELRKENNCQTLVLRTLYGSELQIWRPVSGGPIAITIEAA